MGSSLAWLVVLAVPLLGMGLAWTVQSFRQAFFLGISISGLELGLALFLLGHFKTGTPGLQFVEHFPLTPFLSYHLGVDGISLLFVLLTALLTFLVMLYGEIVHEQPAGIYVASVFAFQSVLMGLFLSVGLLEFWFVMLLELIPVSFTLQRWGVGQDRRRAFLRYLQDMLGGLGLMVGVMPNRPVAGPSR